MRLLLDTHSLLWWVARSSRLGSAATSAIAAAENDVFVSPVSVYEIGIKRTIGKLRAPDDLETQLTRHAFAQLPISHRHAAVAGDLPLHHRDPFDRLLVAQARCEGLTLVTADRKLAVYEVPILPAGD